MYGGQDKGFAISYWKLSYRRKFIRTVLGSIFGSVVIIALMVGNPELAGWPMYALLAVSILGGVVQAIYNYRHWKTKCRTEPSAE